MFANAQEGMNDVGGFSLFTFFMSSIQLFRRKPSDDRRDMAVVLSSSNEFDYDAYGGTSWCGKTQT